MYCIIRFSSPLTRFVFLNFYLTSSAARTPLLRTIEAPFQISAIRLILLTNTITWPSSERNIEIRANIHAFHLEFFLCQLIDNGADNHSGVLVRARDN